jgi:hypothetical protein
MNQILGINLQNFTSKESLTGCHRSETLPDDSYVPIGLETRESTVGAKTDWLSDKCLPNAAILGIAQTDGEDLSEIGQEADHSSEIDRFVTDLLPEKDTPETSFSHTLFSL